MWFGLVSLFPEMFAALHSGISGRAIESGLIELHYWNPRDYTQDKNRRVDDSPYGGGPGMVMQVQPLRSAIRAARAAAPDPENACLVYLSPQGKQFEQVVAEQFAWQQAADSPANKNNKKSLILVAGRYEGIDERLFQLEPGEHWSIGDYILSGGELAAMVVIDAITRLIPARWVMRTLQSGLSQHRVTGASALYTTRLY